MRQGRLTVSALGEEQACLEAGARVLCGLRKVLTGPILFPPVEPAPPVLVFNQTEEILIVNATYQLPPCVPQPDLNYEVDFWKEGTKNKVRSPLHAPQAESPSPMSQQIPALFTLRALPLNASSRKPSMPTSHCCNHPLDFAV